ncbi:MAG: LCP family protein, partial [Clostridia bacterium]|nr:LCP family protein [Clostridia bacterium]
MDDIFFSDKPNQHKSKANQPQDHQPFDGAAPQDAFSGRQTQDNAGRFVVQMPDEEKPVVLRDRTPKGRPVTSEPVTPKVPDYQLSQTKAFDDSVYLRPAQEQPRPCMQHRPPQPRPVNTERVQPQRPARVAVPEKRRKKKKGAGRKVLAAVLIVLVFALVALFAYGYHILGKVGYDKDYSHENAYVEASALASSPRVRNILCIGSDARGDVEGNRSDTMVLVSVDNVHHKLKMTSFLRDSFVYIPAKGFNAKLNAAFAWGGAKMLVDTIEYNFKVRIDDYVIIDFEGFKKLIDLMGGLDVDGVTAAEAKYMRDVVKIVYCKEGKNHFTGAASLWYCRIRKLDDDFHRTERQRKV